MNHWEVMTLSEKILILWRGSGGGGVALQSGDPPRLQPEGLHGNSSTDGLSMNEVQTSSSSM